jgi:hypothetical protein
MVELGALVTEMMTESKRNTVSGVQDGVERTAQPPPFYIGICICFGKVFVASTRLLQIVLRWTSKVRQDTADGQIILPSDIIQGRQYLPGALAVL